MGFKVRYHWKRHTTHIIIGNHSNLTVSNATPQDNDQYYCIAITEGGYAFSNNVTVTVNGKACMYYLLFIFNNNYTVTISIAIQPSRIVAAEGESINITIIAEGLGKENFRYQWRRRDSLPLSNTTSGTDTQNLMITSVAFSDSGSYYCVVTNQWEYEVDSDYVAVTILSK